MAERRSLYIDYIRLGAIVLVVMVHAAVTYSGVGSWYFKDSVAHSALEALPLIFFQSFSQSFFMGLLFLLAGYMIPGGLDKKGAAGFLRDRLVRLGGPTLVYMLALQPLIQYGLIGKAEQSFADYFAVYYLGGQFLGASGPLWFALALLIFSFVYVAAVRRTAFFARGQNRQTPFAATDIVSLSLLIAVATFLIRLVQPIGSSVLNMQLGNFAQYIVFFAVGTRAARARLFDRIDYRLGLRCLQTALLPGVAVWLAIFVAAGKVSPNVIDAIKGGFQWLSLAYACWESANGVLMSFGLLAVCREKLNGQNAFVQRLADSSFAVYVFHAPILVTVSLLLAPLAWGLWVKFAAAGLIALVASFFLAVTVFNRIPLFRTAPPGRPAKQTA